MVRFFPASAVQGVFLFGDQTPQRPLEKELEPLGSELVQRTWFVLGNHDADQELFLRNHFGMWRRHLHGRVVTVGGMRVGGLSGTFHEDIWDPPSDPVYASRAELSREEPSCLDIQQDDSGILMYWTSIFPEDVYSLFASSEVDVLLMHEAPGDHRHGFSVLDQLVASTGASVVLHGHHHENTEGRLEPDVQVFGLGMKQCMILTLELVFPGGRPVAGHEGKMSRFFAHLVLQKKRPGLYSADRWLSS